MTRKILLLGMIVLAIGTSTTLAASKPGKAVATKAPVVPLGTPQTSAQERKDRYKSLLLEYFSKPRHPLVNEENWLYARAGIVSQFEVILSNVPNATLEIQDFLTQVLYQPNFPTQVAGQNIIATFRGERWQTGKDEIILIGAHYDSDGSTLLSVGDNGSGVAALLEVARGLADAIVNRHARLVNTVIFAAFDVQRFEHELVGELDHGSGSKYYVQEKLAPLLNNEPKPMFTGAIILDSIMNYNSSQGSQILPNGYDVSFPEARQYIKDNNYTGNYINLVTKERLRSLRLDAAVAQAWKTMDPPGRFPMVTLEVRRNYPTPALFEFIRQDHVAFWNYHVVPGGEESPLPAILLTDTGKWRGFERMCGTAPCEASNLLTADRLDMLDQTVLTLYRFVSENQMDGTIVVKPPNSAMSVLSAGLPAVLVAFLVSFLAI